MGSWIRSTLGALNLDQLAQLGVEFDLGRADRYAVIGWASTGERFAVAEGFESREAAGAWIASVTETDGG